MTWTFPSTTPSNTIGSPRTLLKNYQLLLILRDGMIWPQGYFGPDAYTAYETDLETPKTFPDPTPVTWITEEQGAAIKDLLPRATAFILCITAATSRSARKTIAK